MPEPTLSDLLAALRELGDDPAARLREMGVRGLPRHCHACPVAVFLAGRLGVPPAAVYVNAADVDLVRPEEPDCLSVQMPASVSDFVERFDGGEYPDLVAAPEAA